MATTRRAEVTWTGDLAKGSGVVTAASSSLFKEAPVSWAARTESPNKTSPEELLAAAHASCFAMGLSNGLGKAGTPPTKLQISAVVTFAPKPEGGWGISESALEVIGTVPGVDQAGFQKAADAAKDGCPVSQALKNNVKLSVKATLA